MTSYLEDNYSKEKLLNEQEKCLSLFNIPSPESIVKFGKFIQIVKDFNTNISSKCLKLPFIIINNIAGELIIQGLFNEEFLNKLNDIIEDNHFVLVYKDRPYKNWCRILDNLDINEEHYFLTLVKQENEYFHTFYCDQLEAYAMYYIIFYYEKKYNLELIIIELDKLYYYPLVMIPIFLTDCICEDIADRLYLSTI